MNTSSVFRLVSNQTRSNSSMSSFLEHELLQLIDLLCLKHLKGAEHTIHHIGSSRVSYQIQ